MLELSKSGVRIELALLGAEILMFKIFCSEKFVKAYQTLSQPVRIYVTYILASLSNVVTALANEML
jgi:hypothetical protein